MATDILRAVLISAHNPCWLSGHRHLTQKRIGDSSHRHYGQFNSCFNLSALGFYWSGRKENINHGIPMAT